MRVREPEEEEELVCSSEGREGRGDGCMMDEIKILPHACKFAAKTRSRTQASSPLPFFPDFFCHLQKEFGGPEHLPYPYPGAGSSCSPAPRPVCCLHGEAPFRHCRHSPSGTEGWRCRDGFSRGSSAAELEGDARVKKQLFKIARLCMLSATP